MQAAHSGGPPLAGEGFEILFSRSRAYGFIPQPLNPSNPVRLGFEPPAPAQPVNEQAIEAVAFLHGKLHHICATVRPPWLGQGLALFLYFTYNYQ